MKCKIYFRADAGASIGYGHFIRTLALADMLKDNFDCTFFTCHPTAYQVGEMGKVCPYVALREETHFDDFLSHLRGDEIVVLDNYFFTTDYQRAIKEKGCRLVCVDDMHDKHYVADVVINHGLIDPALFDVESYTKLCLGFDWALLRKPFLEATKKPHAPVERFGKVAICFGGSDEYDNTGLFIKKILAIGNVDSITAIVGDGYKPIYGKFHDKRVKYYSCLSAEDLASLFCDVDLVVCSASTVCIEALACGAKVAVGWYVDNQKDLYDLLVDRGRVMPLGHIEQPLQLDFCFKVPQNKSIISKHIQQKYTNLFFNLSQGSYLRDVREEDIGLLYSWINDPVDRRNSYNTHEISYSEHCKWFANCMSDRNILIYMLIHKEHIIGQIRLYVNRGIADIGYSIAPEYRGMGYGHVLMELLNKEVSWEDNIQILLAEVKDCNISSQRVFIKAGYRESEKELAGQRILVYTKEA